MNAYAADQNVGRLTILRGKIQETHDDGETQLITASGMKGQRFSKVGRNLPFGFSSHAPAGSIGHFLAANGRPDQVWALGFEHPEHRPRNLGAGFTAIYNSHGDIVSLVEQEIRIVTGKVVFTCDLEITGNITHTGNYNQTGVHIDSNGPHTA